MIGISGSQLREFNAELPASRLKFCACPPVLPSRASKRRERNERAIMMLRTLGRSGNVKVFWTMKSTTVLSLMIATIICLLSGCSKAQQISANSQPLASERKILIVYLSRTNNTKAIAEFIHQKVGGTMVALELETPYPADYNATVQQVA